MLAELFALFRCLYNATSPEAHRGYVNTCVVAAMFKSMAQAIELHSSFVVFYFVFVFRLPFDVNQGAIAFIWNWLLQFHNTAETLGEKFLYLFLFFHISENSKERGS